MSSKVILVVDDHPLNLKLVTDLLAMEGYTMLTSIDAEQAQELLNHTLPDLILMDIALPGMDGLALTRLIKADERTKHIPVVALTSFAMIGDDEKAKAAGCDGYVTKPINTRELPKIVADLLDSRGRPT